MEQSASQPQTKTPKSTHRSKHTHHSHLKAQPKTASQQAHRNDEETLKAHSKAYTLKAQRVQLGYPLRSTRASPSTRQRRTQQASRHRNQTPHPPSQSRSKHNQLSQCSHRLRGQTKDTPQFLGPPLPFPPTVLLQLDGIRTNVAT